MFITLQSPAEYQMSEGISIEGTRKMQEICVLLHRFLVYYKQTKYHSYYQST